jgi:hypothetical protein
MPNGSLQQELMQLLEDSQSIKKLSIEDQAKVKQRLIKLPPEKIRQAIKVLQTEKHTMTIFDQKEAAYDEKLHEVSADLKRQTLDLQKALASHKEKLEKEKSSASTENLLEALREPPPQKKKKKRFFGLF